MVGVLPRIGSLTFRTLAHRQNKFKKRVNIYNIYNHILVFDLRVQLRHCTYQRKTLLFALIKISTFICKREISVLSFPLAVSEGWTRVPGAGSIAPYINTRSNGFWLDCRSIFCSLPQPPKLTSSSSKLSSQQQATKAKTTNYVISLPPCFSFISDSESKIQKYVT